MATETIAFTKQDQLARIDEVIRNAKHVRLNIKRLEEVATRAPASMATQWIDAYRTADEHYRSAPPIQLSDLDQIQFAFVFGTQGWLIWEWTPERRAIPLDEVIDGVHYIGSYSMFAFHYRAMRLRAEGKGKDFLDADVLATLTLEDVQDHYTDDNGKLSVQMLERRLENFREMGQVLKAEFGGHGINVLRKADGYLFRPDGNGLIQLMQTRFPISWRDWPMAKLPNVIPLGLYEARQRRKFSAEIDRLLNFKDYENISGGADYYRPWFFVRVGIFDISDEFKRKLRDHELIEPESDMEQEYRAFTIVALRRLAELTGGWPQSLNALEVETHAVAFLHCRRCRVGISDAELPCAYRDVCKATHDDHELMDAAWPLVMTNHY
jgi:hypothetical protein